MISTLEAWGDGSSDFEDVLRGWTDLAEVEEPPRPIGGIFDPYGPGPHPPMEGGLWTWTYRSYLRDLKVTLIDLAEVAEGWSQVLGDAAVEHAPENTRGSSEAYRGLYDSRKLREWVRDADRELIDVYGYRFLKPSKVGPVMEWPAR